MQGRRHSLHKHRRSLLNGEPTAPAPRSTPRTTATTGPENRRRSQPASPHRSSEGRDSGHTEPSPPRPSRMTPLPAWVLPKSFQLPHGQQCDNFLVSEQSAVAPPKRDQKAPESTPEPARKPPNGKGMSGQRTHRTKPATVKPPATPPGYGNSRTKKFIPAPGLRTDPRAPKSQRPRIPLNGILTSEQNAISPGFHRVEGAGQSRKIRDVFSLSFLTRPFEGSSIVVTP